MAARVICLGRAASVSCTSLVTLAGKAVYTLCPVRGDSEASRLYFNLMADGVLKDAWRLPLEIVDPFHEFTVWTRWFFGKSRYILGVDLLDERRILEAARTVSVEIFAKEELHLLLLLLKDTKVDTHFGLKFKAFGVMFVQHLVLRLQIMLTIVWWAFKFCVFVITGTFLLRCTTPATYFLVVGVQRAWHISLLILVMNVNRRQRLITLIRSTCCDVLQRSTILSVTIAAGICLDCAQVVILHFLFVQSNICCAVKHNNTLVKLILFLQSSHFLWLTHLKSFSIVLDEFGALFAAHADTVSHFYVLVF